MNTNLGENRLNGKIKNYIADKGFGFIAADEDYFFHISQFKDSITPEKGMNVSFIPSSNAKGACAKDVKPIKAPVEKQIQALSFEEVFKLNFSENKKEKKTSKVKAAGLKSTFIVDADNAVLTSFGKGNTAIIEKEINKDMLFNVQNNFSAVLNDTKIDIIGAINGLTHNPIKSEMTGETMIYSKSALEKQFFGREFNDNIHIQIIHNILDIKKILAVHINNITYSINNIRRTDNVYSDFIGHTWIKLDVDKNPKNDGKSDYENYRDSAKIFAKENITYDDFQQFLNNDRLAYFGNAFYKSAGKDKMIERSEQDIYYILAILRELRNVCSHSPEHNKNKTANIYNLENRLNSEAKYTLNSIYNEKIESVGTTNFVKNNCSKNFPILFAAMNADDNQKIEIAKNFYNFTMKKTYKNSGFSIKKLREYMLDMYGSELKSDSIQMNSVRSKAYQMLDFVIWDYYNKNPEKADKIISELKTALTDKENHLVYYNKARELYSAIKNEIEIITQKIKNISDNKYHITDKNLIKNIEKAISDEAFINADQVSWFSKLIYLATLFLDGKEINDLITTLINKLDNIASLSAVAKCRFEKNNRVKFVEEYKFFDSDKLLRLKAGTLGIDPEDYECVIVEELRNINSFARMTKAIAIKRGAFEDAAQLLNTSMSDNSLDGIMYYYDCFILKKRFDELEKQKKSGKSIDLTEYASLKEKIADIDYRKLPNSKIDSGMRNFIINNVIQSKKFNYIVRYADPAKIKSCVKNRELIKFVFRDISDTQIDRYYKACFGQNCSDRKTKIDYLVNLVCSFSYAYIKDVNQQARQTDPQKQQKRTIVSLYLNVLYQIAKNLVYVNSRYVIAFHCLERDNLLFGNKFDNAFSLTKMIIEKNMQKADEALEKDKQRIPELKERFGYSDDENHPVRKYEARIAKKYEDKKKVYDYLSLNIRNVNENKDIIGAFRNTVAHLNAIRMISNYVEGAKNISSYFQLYHYIVQLSLEDSEHNTEQTSDYISRAKDKGVYSKDFVKALCSPFGYNLPRFKNLSIDELFDMNDTRTSNSTSTK